MTKLFVARFVGDFRAALSGMGLLTDHGVWIQEEKVLACAFPRTDTAFVALAEQGITLLVNLHERQHPPERLLRHRMTEIHLPVPDFAAPTPETIDAGITALQVATAEGKRVAVHCGGGLGRTGTLLACYLLTCDPALGPEEALAAVRGKRPGSIETSDQESAVKQFAARFGNSQRPEI